MELINIKDYFSKIILIDSIHRNKKYDKVAKIHKYWSRKPWYLIEKSILEYSNPGDTIVDPFIGSGTVALEGLLNNRKIIGYDLNPFACYLSNSLISNIDFDNDLYLKEFEEIKCYLENDVLPLYAINKEKDKFILYWFSGIKKPIDHNVIITDINFKVKIKSNIDLKILEKKYKKPLKLPKNEFPKEFYKDRFSYKGYKKVTDFYSSRNLLALSLLHEHIENSNYTYKDLFLLAFTNTVLHASYLKGTNVRPLGVNNYWIPDDHIQENVVWRFLDRATNISISKNTIKERWIEKGKPDFHEPLIHNRSSLLLEDFGNSTIDYVITDPPYGDVIQYSELSFIWNSWLNFEYKNTDEVIINPKQKKGEEEFLNSIELFIDNTYRILKTGGKFTLCFQNKNINIWYSILDKIKKTGFSLFDVKIYETLGSTYNQNWAKFSPKNDLYVTFIKTNTVHENTITEEIDPSLLIDEIRKEIILNHKNESVELIYDLFIASIIHLLFNNVKINKIEKLTIKKLIELMLHNKEIDGYRKKGDSENIQEKLQF